MDAGDSQDSELFLILSGNALRAAKALYPDKIIVLLPDGALTHSTSDKWCNMTPSKMNIKKVDENDAKPISFERVSEELGSSFNVKEKVVVEASKKKRKGAAVETKKVWRSRKDIVDDFKETDLYLLQRNELESLAESMDCLVLYLPHSHPHLSSIEYVWRRIKEEYRNKYGENTKANLWAIIEPYLLGKVEMEETMKRVQKTCSRYRYYLCSAEGRQAGDVPTENQMKSAKMMRDFSKPSKEYKEGVIGVRSKVGDPNTKDAIDLKLHFRWCHAINAGRAKKVDFETEEGKAILTRYSSFFFFFVCIPYF